VAVGEAGATVLSAFAQSGTAPALDEALLCADTLVAGQVAMLVVTKHAQAMPAKFFNMEPSSLLPFLQRIVPTK